MVKGKFNISTLVSDDGCFDLQFRKETRKERVNSPTYYRWKVQFVITVPKEKARVLNKIKNFWNCGQICLCGNQARYSVQKIDDLAHIVIPFFRKNPLMGKKKKDFELWVKAVEIIKKNKSKPLINWKKNDIYSLIEIHKSCAKYKKRPRKSKWLEAAKNYLMGRT